MAPVTTNFTLSSLEEITLYISQNTFLSTALSGRFLKPHLSSQSRRELQEQSLIQYIVAALILYKLSHQSCQAPPEC